MISSFHDKFRRTSATFIWYSFVLIIYLCVVAFQVSLTHISESCTRANQLPDSRLRQTRWCVGLAVGCSRDTTALVRYFECLCIDFRHHCATSDR